MPSPTVSPVDRATFLREWVKDLESGAYAQTRGQLWRAAPDTNPARPRAASYCCLGIACLTGQRLGIPGSSFNSKECSHQGKYAAGCGDWWNDLVKPGNYCGSLHLRVPPALQKKSGSDSGSAIFLNDTAEFTFAEISQCVRFTFPDVFKES